jgi:hypothetical protein
MEAEEIHEETLDRNDALGQQGAHRNEAQRVNEFSTDPLASMTIESTFSYLSNDLSYVWTTKTRSFVRKQ